MLKRRRMRSDCFSSAGRSPLLRSAISRFGSADRRTGGAASSSQKYGGHSSCSVTKSKRQQQDLEETAAISEPTTEHLELNGCKRRRPSRWPASGAFGDEFILRCWMPIDRRFAVSDGS